MEHGQKSPAEKISINGRRPEVLVIEDDPHIQRAVVRTLEWAGCTVDVAGTAAEGRERFRDGHPNLVLLDIGLPDDSGFNVCRQFRKEEKKEIPILFMTVQDDLSSRVRGFEAGGQDFILKPFYLKELVARVRVHLGISMGWETMNSLNHQLKARDQNRLNLVDMIVHDLKLPLTAINGNLRIIDEDGHVDSEGLKLLHSSERAVKSMENLIDDILKIGQNEQGVLQTRNEILSAADILKEVAELFGPSCRLRGMKLSVSVLPQTLRLFADPQLVSRILANLISNAAKCNREGEDILIECFSAPSGVRFAVSDRGPGVPDIDKKRIFAKFEHFDKSGLGTVRAYGIGLFFCRSAAAALRGRLWVEDREGGGARFVLEIPDAVGGTYD